MKLYKKTVICLSFVIMCSFFCGFVNQSASSAEFQKLPKTVIIEQQIIIKDLYIPKININTNIYSDISSLDKGICYWRNAIIGHNNNKTGFNKLQFLQIEDILFYKNIKYILADIKIVNKEQVSLVVDSQYPIILFTCHYINEETKRLVLYYEEK